MGMIVTTWGLHVSVPGHFAFFDTSDGELPHGPARGTINTRNQWSLDFGSSGHCARHHRDLRAEKRMYPGTVRSNAAQHLTAEH